MQDEMISIIVPVYKAEPWINRCVNSILKQTYRNFELILVDDGSPDRCGEICDEYAIRDNRIIVIHQENKGVSAARNVGLELATGNFFVFVDSDDAIDHDYLYRMMLAIGDADCVVCGAYRFYRGILQDKRIPEDKSYEGNELIRQSYMYEGLNNWFIAPWSKMYRKKILQEIRFDEKMPVGEDIVFNLHFLKKAEKIQLFPYAGYFLHQNPISTTHRIQQNYSPLFEHDYTLIRDSIWKAKQEWGFPNVYLENERAESVLSRTYLELMNLVRKGSPYSRRECNEKIKLIIKDQYVRSNRRTKPFKSCLRSEKMTKICLAIPFTEIVRKVLKIAIQYEGK